jgi:hypothetical protein
VFVIDNIRHELITKSAHVPYNMNPQCFIAMSYSPWSVQFTMFKIKEIILTGTLNAAGCAFTKLFSVIMQSFFKTRVS